MAEDAANVGDALIFWHPRQDRRTPDDWFNWGTVAPGSSADTVFRVRNMSYQYTATDVVVALTQLGSYNPALQVPLQHFLSLNNRQFLSSAALGDLKPRAVSPAITLRRVTAKLADLGKGEFILTATPADWQ